jgi:lysozyme
MKINKAGIALIKQFEGFRATAYKCPADVLTIGYGFTKGVKQGDKMTLAFAEGRLIKELEEYEACVDKAVKVNITANQFSALVCFVFNIGCGAFTKSTLLKKLNAGDKAGASLEFLRWNKAGGKVLAGLTKRRNAEMQLFNS